MHLEVEPLAILVRFLERHDDPVRNRFGIGELGQLRWVRLGRHCVIVSSALKINCRVDLARATVAQSRRSSERVAAQSLGARWAQALKDCVLHGHDGLEWNGHLFSMRHDI